MSLLETWITPSAESDRLFSLCLEVDQASPLSLRLIELKDRRTGKLVLSGPLGYFTQIELMEIATEILDYFSENR